MSPNGAATRWTGWDPTQGSSSASPEELLGQHDAAGGVLFELLALAGRGFRPPRYLTVVDTLAGDGAERTDDATQPSGPFRMSWSVEYRRIAETAPTRIAPYAVYLLGVEPPSDITAAELEVFNDFYTEVHLREVADRRHALRAERYEQLRVIRPPAKGAPRFLAVYEFDEEGASHRRHVGPPYSAGPDVWQRHTTPWRLWYRRIPT